MLLFPLKNIDVENPGIKNVRNSINHVQAHFDAALGMVIARLWDPGDAVVAVTQEFDAQAVVLGG